MRKAIPTLVVARTLAWDSDAADKEWQAAKDRARTALAVVPAPVPEIAIPAPVEPSPDTCVQAAAPTPEIAIPDPAPTPAPKYVQPAPRVASTAGPMTYTRVGADPSRCKCFQCGGSIPQGGAFTLDSKGNAIHADCTAYRDATVKATCPPVVARPVVNSRKGLSSVAPKWAGVEPRQFTRQAPVGCAKCSRTIPAGEPCLLVAGRFVCASHYPTAEAAPAAAPAPVAAPAPTPAAPVAAPVKPVAAPAPVAAPTSAGAAAGAARDAALAAGLSMGEAAAAAMDAGLAWCAAQPVEHDSHVMDYRAIERAVAQRDADDAAALAAQAPAAAPKVAAPAAPVAAGGFQADVDAASLRQAVALCYATAERRGYVPILNNVSVRSKQGRTVLQATNLTTWVACEVTGSGRGDGAYTVPAKALRDMAPKGEGTVSLAYEGGETLAVAGSALRGLPAADFPKAPSIGGLPGSTYPVDALRDAIERTVGAVATDESRYHISGAMLGNRDGHGVMVATDGHRLHMVECEQWPWDADVIVPRDGLKVLSRALRGRRGEVRMVIAKGEYESKYLHVRADGLAVACKLVDASFPPFEMVVPRAADRSGRITIPAADLIAACERCGKVSGDRIKSMKLEGADGMLTATAENLDKGSVKVEYVCVQDGGALRIGINGAYLLDWLATVKQSNVVIEYQGELDPLVVRLATGRESLCVVMPMRI